jgi:2,3-bisphosphoglycerate-dependent phosphoglycerate mutase
LNFQNDVIFVRHAESIGNTISQDERAALDIPNHKYQLTPKGRVQARLAGEYLKMFIEQQRKYRVIRSFQSTFVRTQETLAVILDQLGVDITPITDPRLDEKWDGIFHELSKKEVGEKYPEQVRLRKRSGYYHYRAPGGESCPDVELRIRSFVQNELLLRQGTPALPNGEADGCDLIVCHGRWSQVFQKYLRGLSVEEFLHIKEKSDNPNCSITIYNSAGKTLINCVNPWEGVLAKDETTFA